MWTNQVDDNTSKSYLNISSAEVEDGGNYCCSIQNSNGASSTSILSEHCARLNVYGNFHREKFQVLYCFVVIVTIAKQKVVLELNS